MPHIWADEQVSKFMTISYSPFMCQDENDTKTVMCKACFVVELHRIIGSFVTGLFQNTKERMKALAHVFVFVFVLVDKQAIINIICCLGY